MITIGLNGLQITSPNGVRLHIPHIPDWDLTAFAKDNKDMDQADLSQEIDLGGGASIVMTFKPPPGFGNTTRSASSAALKCIFVPMDIGTKSVELKESGKLQDAKTLGWNVGCSIGYSWD